VFGDWNLREAVFNSGTSIDVEPNISLSNGASIKPPCVASVPGGVRGETNSLTLLSPCESGIGYIYFSESRSKR
jgi:hypothetical protein